MDSTQRVLWARYQVEAAIEYLTARRALPGLVIDNDILDDGVFKTLSKDRSEFVLCVAPGYTTQLGFSEEHLDVTVRFDTFVHALSIPYAAIRAVISLNSPGLMTDDGMINVITVAPAVLPAGQRHRNRKLEEAKVDDIQPQPEQENLFNEVLAPIPRRRRSDRP